MSINFNKVSALIDSGAIPESKVDEHLKNGTEVSKALARHYPLKPHQYELAQQSPRLGVASEADTNTNVPSETIHHFIDTNNTGRITFHASRGNTMNDSHFNRLADSNDFRMRTIAARKTSSPEIMEKLSRDQDANVKGAVLVNKNPIPENVKRNLIDDPDPDMIPHQTHLVMWLKDPSPYHEHKNQSIRLASFRNVNLSPENMEKYSKGNDPIAHMGIMDNRNVTNKVIRNIANAGHPATSNVAKHNLEKILGKL